MAGRSLVGLSDAARQVASRLDRIESDDDVEMHIRLRDGEVRTLILAPEARSLIETLLSHLSAGDRVAILSEDQDLSPPPTPPFSWPSHVLWWFIVWRLAI